uniref:Uncharacterized protein n=1 Tax=Timema shepardi TaxID=629360 RepID=A0A7R9B220_TIMSH|nr:unnamed protein product [Timema shepardi]
MDVQKPSDSSVAIVLKIVTSGHISARSSTTSHLKEDTMSWHRAAPPYRPNGQESGLELIGFGNLRMPSEGFVVNHVRCYQQIINPVIRCPSVLKFSDSSPLNKCTSGEKSCVDEDVGKLLMRNIVTEVLNNNIQAEDEASGDEEDNSSVVQERPIAISWQIGQLTIQWVPYTKAPNVCELNCMPRGERFYYRHKRKVVDGTRCDDEKLDICVDGQCLVFSVVLLIDAVYLFDPIAKPFCHGSLWFPWFNTKPSGVYQGGYNSHGGHVPNNPGVVAGGATLDHTPLIHTNYYGLLGLPEYKHKMNTGNKVDCKKPVLEYTDSVNHLPQSSGTNHALFSNNFKVGYSSSGSYGSPINGNNNDYKYYSFSAPGTYGASVISHKAYEEHKSRCCKNKNHHFEDIHTKKEHYDDKHCSSGKYGGYDHYDNHGKDYDHKHESSCKYVGCDHYDNHGKDYGHKHESSCKYGGYDHYDNHGKDYDHKHESSGKYGGYEHYDNHGKDYGHKHESSCKYGGYDHYDNHGIDYDHYDNNGKDYDHKHESSVKYGGYEHYANHAKDYDHKHGSSGKYDSYEHYDKHNKHGKDYTHKRCSCHKYGSYNHHEKHGNPDKYCVHKHDYPDKSEDHEHNKSNNHDKDCYHKHDSLNKSEDHEHNKSKNHDKDCYHKHDSLNKSEDHEHNKSNNHDQDCYHKHDSPNKSEDHEHNISNNPDKDCDHKHDFPDKFNEHEQCKKCKDSDKDFDHKHDHPDKFDDHKHCKKCKHQDKDFSHKHGSSCKCRGFGHHDNHVKDCDHKHGSSCKCRGFGHHDNHGKDYDHKHGGYDHYDKHGKDVDRKHCASRNARYSLLEAETIKVHLHRMPKIHDEDEDLEKKDFGY